MGMIKNAILAGSGALAAALAFSAPANAAVVVCYGTGNTQPQCPGTNVNVLVDQQTGATVGASDNDSTTNVLYSFTSSTEATLTQNASGQANVESTDGSLQQINFNILGGASASLITFNLLPLGPQSTVADAQSVVVTFAGGSQTIVNLNGSGNNFYGILATAGEQLTGLSFGNFQPTGSGVQALQQVRLNLNPTVAAVPEPGTWALMLLGFGAVGASLRRSRRRSSGLLQMA